jgi:hypothetical protein
MLPLRAAINGNRDADMNETRTQLYNQSLSIVLMWWYQRLSYIEAHSMPVREHHTNTGI